MTEADSQDFKVNRQQTTDNRQQTRQARATEEGSTVRKLGHRTLDEKTSRAQGDPTHTTQRQHTSTQRARLQRAQVAMRAHTIRDPLTYLPTSQGIKVGCNCKHPRAYAHAASGGGNAPHPLWTFRRGRECKWLVELLPTPEYLQYMWRA